MTENEAIELHIAENLHRIEVIEEFLRTNSDADDKECKKNIRILTKVNGALQEIQQYRSIGTVKECREARERQRARKIVIKNTKNKNLERGIYVFYKCPKCEEQIASGFYYPPHNEFLQEHKFCENCGQAIDWSE